MKYSDMFKTSVPTETIKAEDFTALEALSWWAKHRNKVYGAFLLIAGILGGNADRFGEWLNFEYAKETRLIALEKEIVTINGRLDALEAKGQEVEDEPEVTPEPEVAPEENNEDYIPITN